MSDRIRPETESDHYVAEGDHREPRVRVLEELLDRYDRAAELVVADTEEARIRSDRERFAARWATFREDQLRGRLEELGWRLERRGHHIWLEDRGPTGESPGLLPLTLRMSPAHFDEVAGPVCGMSVVPDGVTMTADVYLWTGTPDGSRVVRHLRIEELAEEHLAAWLAEAVTPSLMGDLPEPPPEPEPEVAAADGAERGGAADGGFPRQRWLTRLRDARDEERRSAELSEDG